MSVLRVAVVHNIPAPSRLALFRRLREDRHIELRVFFAAPSERNRHWRVDITDDDWAVLLPGRTVNLGRKDLIAVHINPGLLDSVRAFEPDVVVLGGYNSPSHLQLALWCRRKGIPYVLWSGSTEYEASVLRHLASPVIRWVVRGAAAYMAYGTRAGDFLRGLGAPPQRIRPVLNTVDVRYLGDQANALRPCREDIRNRLGLEAEAKALLFVGQIIERKGLRDLLAAISRLVEVDYNIRLLVAGTGQLESELRHLYGGAPVSWLGHLETRALAELYVASDLTILPSIEEVWGLVVNEAMACGSLVVASDACGASEDLVRHGETGFVFHAGDVDSLTATIREALDLPHAGYRGIVRSAELLVRTRFTIESAATRFIEAVTIASVEGV